MVSTAMREDRLNDAAPLVPDAGTDSVLNVIDRVADAGPSHEVGDPLPHLRSLAAHRPVAAVRDLGDLDAALAQCGTSRY